VVRAASRCIALSCQVKRCGGWRVIDPITGVRKPIRLMHGNGNKALRRGVRIARGVNHDLIDDANRLETLVRC
jgi:hypothetical protein